MCLRAPTVQISRNVALARTCTFARGLINRPKKGVAPVALADITKHTQGCTLTNETGATPPPSAIIKPRANPRARANAMLRVICTIYRS